MFKITAKDAVRIFEETKVRAQWNEEEEKWYFSVIDVVAVLSGTERPRRYWNDLKKKLAKRKPSYALGICGLQPCLREAMST